MHAAAAVLNERGCSVAAEAARCRSRLYAERGFCSTRRSKTLLNLDPVILGTLHLFNFLQFLA